MTSDRYISLGQLMISVLEHVWPEWPKKDAWLSKQTCLSLMRNSPGSASSTRPYDPLHCKTGLLCSFRITRGSLTRIWIWFVHCIWYHKCPFHQISSSLQAHLCRKDRLAKGQRPHKSDRMNESYQKDKKTSNHIKTYTLLQFVLISWDNQLRFPFWDRTFLLKAKCTAVLQVSYRFIDDWNRYHCQDFEIVYQKLNFAASVRDIFFTCSAALLHVWVLAHISSLSWSP